MLLACVWTDKLKKKKNRWEVLHVEKEITGQLIIKMTDFLHVIVYQINIFNYFFSVCCNQDFKNMV